MSQLFFERLIAAIKAPFESFIAPQSSFNLLFLALTLGEAIYATAATALRSPPPLDQPA